MDPDDRSAGRRRARALRLIRNLAPWGGAGARAGEAAERLAGIALLALAAVLAVDRLS